jgi:hypothetical protein
MTKMIIKPFLGGQCGKSFAGGKISQPMLSVVIETYNSTTLKSYNIGHWELITTLFQEKM